MFKFIERLIDKRIEARLREGSSTNPADAKHLTISADDIVPVGRLSSQDPRVDIAPVYAAEAERAGQAAEPTLSKALNPAVAAAVSDAEALMARGGERRSGGRFIPLPTKRYSLPLDGSNRVIPVRDPVIVDPSNAADLLAAMRKKD